MQLSGFSWVSMVSINQSIDRPYKSSMDVANSLRPDSILGETDPDHPDTETSRQDPKRTCTRTSPCFQRECMLCNTPINHVHNLDVALNGSNASPSTHIRNLDVALNSRNASPITHICNLDVALNGSNAHPPLQPSPTALNCRLTTLSCSSLARSCLPFKRTTSPK